MNRRKHRPMIGARKVKSAPVVVLKTDPRVWSAALELAGGDVSRLERVDETTVIVHNHGGRKGS